MRSATTVPLFEIHSPTPTSSKWWVGAAGKTATHGVVQAKLILPDGKDMGPHLFFIQLRSLGMLRALARAWAQLTSYILDDHNPLPGVILGDIGEIVHHVQ